MLARNASSESAKQSSKSGFKNTTAPSRRQAPDMRAHLTIHLAQAACGLTLLAIGYYVQAWGFA